MKYLLWIVQILFGPTFSIRWWHKVNTADRNVGFDGVPEPDPITRLVDALYWCLRSAWCAGFDLSGAARYQAATYCAGRGGFDNHHDWRG